MTEEEHAKNLLTKYADDNLDSASRQKVDDWYDALDKDPILISKSRKAEMNRQIYSALRKAMTANGTNKVISIASVLRRTGMAAAILLVAGSVFLLKHQNGQKPPAVKLLTVTTIAGETKSVKLPDGSEILLNPSSKITYAPDFNISHRTIELSEGEAFFNIAHDEQHPFQVKTAEGIITKVLGTSFRIKSYQARKRLDVIVATGKVEIGNSRETFGTLIRGQQLSYDKAIHRAEITYTPSPVSVELKFDNVTLEDVMLQLEYAYSIRIILNPSLRNLKCEATFTTKQEPSEILEVLCALHHLKYKASDNYKTFKVDKI